jgi:DNA-directed RNA polymerase sigma subunit (sigma70/sigma32)
MNNSQSSKESAYDAVQRFLRSPSHLEAVSNTEERIEGDRKKRRVSNLAERRVQNKRAINQTTNMSPERHANKRSSDHASNMSPVRLNNRREQQVIRLRYGFQDGVAYSLAEIGRALELSRERVRQIETKALQKLRQPRRRNLIRDYFDALS